MAAFFVDLLADFFLAVFLTVLALDDSLALLADFFLVAIGR